MSNYDWWIKDQTDASEKPDPIAMISSQLVALALKEAYERGETIEIPSLGIKIKKDDNTVKPVPESSSVAWW